MTTTKKTSPLEHVDSVAFLFAGTSIKETDRQHGMSYQLGYILHMQIKILSNERNMDCLMKRLKIGFMVLNATLNNISVISRRSVLLVEETVAPRENHRPVASQRQTLSHHVVSSTPRLTGV